MGGVAAAPAFKKIMSQIISHPELEFAEKILNITPPAEERKKQRENHTVRVPILCGITREHAGTKLDSLGLRYRFMGSGNMVTYQTPSAGVTIGSDTEIQLYLRASGNTAGKEALVPDCIGKDLRDAVNMVNMEGLRPFVQGCGVVRRQNPKGGSPVHAAEVCTLYCSFEG